MRSRRWIVLGVGALASLPLTACGDVEELSLCRAYDDFLEQRAAVRDIDLETTTAGEAEELAEDYLATVRRLEELDEARYGAQLYDLENAAQDVLRTLASVPDDVDASTWAPLVEDSVEEAAHLAVAVEARLGLQCAPEADD